MPAQGYQPHPEMTAVVRPMTDAERQSAQAIPKPQRYNAIGISVVAMAMAIMVNFVEDTIVVIMPLFFGFVGLGLAIQARKSSGAVAGALAKGTVTEVRGTSRRKGGAWDMGAFSIPRNSRLQGSLVDGKPASLAIMPEMKHVLSVNGVCLGKPVAFTARSGFENTLTLSTVPQPAPQTSPAADDQELPPPPDDFTPRSCPRCGKAVPEGVVFCEMCGYRLKP